MNEFIISNIEWVITIAFIAGGGWFLLQSLSKKIDEQSREIKARFDKLTDKDDEHDRSIALHDKEIAVIKAQMASLTGWMQEMRSKINDIYKQMFEGK